jgi:prepilin-type N-terminal cleavage/methylation domain-containing protein
MKTPNVASPSFRAPRPARRAAQRGMTLVEIMIVVVIMGLIASAVGIAVFNQAKKARVKTAEQEARTIEHAVQLWAGPPQRLPDDVAAPRATGPQPQRPRPRTPGTTTTSSPATTAT